MLRFVPDPARGEFVNVGVVAGDADGGDWELRLVQNLRRAKAIDDTGSLSLALSFAAKLADHIDAVDQLPGTGVEPITLELLAQWAEEMHNVVQLSAPAPIVADSADAALDILVSELVVDLASAQHRFDRKHKAVASTRHAYRAHNVPEDSITERAPITAGAYDGTFDFAVSNGEVVQLVQCWSFQLPNQVDLAEQVKAWAWVVRGLREHGGKLQSGDRELAIPAADIEVAAVYIPPAEGQEDAHAFEEARAAFGETGVLALTRDEADAVGESAAQRLHVAV